LLGESEDINDLVIKLLEVFTDQKASATTKVVIADNPKVLTAVGAINEKYIGKDENISKKVDNIVHIGVGTDPKLQEVTTEAGDNAAPSEMEKKPELNDVLQFVEDYSEASFDEMALKAKDENEIDDELEETLFFWYLKDVLYPLSQKLYEIKS